MNKILKYVFAFLIGLSTYAHAGDGPNGSCPMNATDLLNELKGQLAIKILGLDDKVVKDLVMAWAPGKERGIEPEKVDKTWLSRTILDLYVPSCEELEKDAYTGIRVFFYEEPITQLHLKAMKPYFLRYGKLPPNETSQAEKREIQRLILLEAAHLWGLSNTPAGEFATKFMKVLFPKAKPAVAAQPAVKPKPRPVVEEPEEKEEPLPSTKLNALVFADEEACANVANFMTQLSNYYFTFSATCQNRQGRSVMLTRFSSSLCDSEEGRNRIEGFKHWGPDSDAILTTSIHVANHLDGARFVTLINQLNRAGETKFRIVGQGDFRGGGDDFKEVKGLLIGDICAMRE